MTPTLADKPMTMTHRFIGKGEPFSVRAWQYLPADRTRGIPVWVARKFHSLGGADLQGLAADGVVISVKPTDWIVCLDQTLAVVLTDAEFQQNFAAL